MGEHFWGGYKIFYFLALEQVGFRFNKYKIFNSSIAQMQPYSINGSFLAGLLNNEKISQSIYLGRI